MNQNSPLQNFVKTLEGRDITLENIKYTKQIELKFSPSELANLENQIKTRIEKWASKRGKYLNEQASNNFTKNFGFFQRLNFVVARVLDCYGINGGSRFNYENLAKRLAKELKFSEISKWNSIAKTQIEFYIKKYDLNEAIAKVIALVTAQAVFEAFISSSK